MENICVETHKTFQMCNLKERNKNKSLTVLKVLILQGGPLKPHHIQLSLCVCTGMYSCQLVAQDNSRCWNRYDGFLIKGKEDFQKSWNDIWQTCYLCAKSSITITIAYTLA